MGCTEIDEQLRAVTDWLDKRAKLTPDRVALIDYSTGSETTFADWNARANRTANYLRSLGIAKGDRVAVYSSNRSEYLDLFWAAPKIGAMLQNLNWRLTVHELKGIVKSGAPANSTKNYSHQRKPRHERPNSSRRHSGNCEDRSIDHQGSFFWPRRRYSCAVHPRQLLFRHVVGRDDACTATKVQGDRSTDSPTSPRSVLRLLVWGPPFIPDREDALVDAMFQVQIGDTCLPGDKETSPNLPYVAPGKWGATNAMSPKYIGNLVERILASDPKVNVLWIYGADDVAVSNSAASDPGTWGPSGLLPGYPGAKEYPPQPMMDQIRMILDDYTRRGGSYEEVAVEGSGHVPFLSHQDEFNSSFHAFLEQSD